MGPLRSCTTLPKMNSPRKTRFVPSFGMLMTVMRLLWFSLVGMGCSEYLVVNKLPVSSVVDTGPTAGETPDTDPPTEDTDPPTGDTGETTSPPPPPPPDTFSYGWHILDEGDWVATTTDPAHPVTYHGDTDAYWYEPSGNHGLLSSSTPESDFASMRDYVLERVPDPTHSLGNLHYYADSDVDSFRYATFSYILCDFWVGSTDDASLYHLDTGPVDDGIEVMVNGSILGFLRLNEGGDSWNLEDHIRLDARNTLIVILADNAERNKFIQDMAFWRGEIMVTGGPGPPPTR